MKKRKLSVMLSIAMATTMLAGMGVSAEDKTFNITAGGIQSAEDVVTLAMQKMADLAAEKSNGTINITVSPAGQLGDATSQMEAVGLGTQEIFVDASSWLSTFVDDALVTSMFFLYRDADHYEQFLQSDIEADFENQLAEQEGIRVIANNWERSPRSFVCKDEWTSLDDLKGLKSRVPDIKSYLESAQAIGLGTAQVAWGETYLAVKQGVVDACESPLDSIYTMKFYETTKHVELTEHIRDGVYVFMNDDLFSSMSESQQTALKEAAFEAGEWYTEQVVTAAEEYKKIMEEEGTVFDVPSEELIADMTAAVAARAEELEAEGMWSEGLFAAIQAIGQ
ncbi:MAG: TRAP transporter substrate-binding protein [Candidatus Limivivens sp.]|nr:TRAP transporter substrate-binding protein [Candidatus Limivivens sp.]